MKKQGDIQGTSGGQWDIPRNPTLDHHFRQAFFLDMASLNLIPVRRRQGTLMTATCWCPRNNSPSMASAWLAPFNRSRSIWVQKWVMGSQLIHILVVKRNGGFSPPEFRAHFGPILTCSLCSQLRPSEQAMRGYFAETISTEEAVLMKLMSKRRHSGWAERWKT